MNNKIRFVSLIGLLFILLLSSCGKKEDTIYSDEYHQGTDWQYYQTTAWGRHPRIQETETGAVLYHDRFLYLYDRKSGSILPLCSKPNCLHDKETDSEKRKECTAFLDNCLGDDRATSLMLYKDELFVCYTRSDLGAPESVYRISLDGKSKDEVLDRTNIEFPLVHRGYLYYFTMEFTVTEGAKENVIDSHWQFCRMNIEQQSPKEEILLKPEENSGVSTIFAFGNHIYFQLAYQGREATSPFMCYDICTGEMEETSIGYDGYMIYQGHMYVLPFDHSASYDTDSSIYRTDYKGNKEKMVLKGVPQGMYMGSDEKYFYTNNALLYSYFGLAEEKHFRVYDEDFQLIDDFTLPDTDTYDFDPPVGGSDYQYLRFEDQETGEWGLYIWDKSSIGTLKGSAYKQEKVVYEKGMAEVNDSTSDITYTDEYVAKYEDWSVKTEDKTEVKANALKGELIFSSDSVKGITSFLEDEFPERNGKPSSLEVTLTVSVRSYYRKGDDVYVRIARISSLNIPAEVEVRPPEDSEGFLGASAVHTMSYTATYASENGSGGSPQTTSGTMPDLKTAAGRVK